MTITTDSKGNLTFANGTVLTPEMLSELKTFQEHLRVVDELDYWLDNRDIDFEDKRYAQQFLHKFADKLIERAMHTDEYYVPHDPQSLDDFIFEAMEPVLNRDDCNYSDFLLTLDMMGELIDIEPIDD